MGSFRPKQQLQVSARVIDHLIADLWHKQASLVPRTAAAAPSASTTAGASGAEAAQAAVATSRQMRSCGKVVVASRGQRRGGPQGLGCLLPACPRIRAFAHQSCGHANLDVAIVVAQRVGVSGRAVVGHHGIVVLGLVSELGLHLQTQKRTRGKDNDSRNCKE